MAVVQTGRRRGFFLSVENIIDKTQRIFRKWLAKRAEATEEKKTGGPGNVPSKVGCEADEMLWVDHNKIVGLRVRVEERKGRRDIPLLLHKDEDQAISYSLELEGKSPYPELKGQVLMLKCRINGKYHASNAGCGKTVARDRRRRKRAGDDFWEFRNTERTVDRPQEIRLIGKGRYLHNAKRAPS